jgi:hypothetical protein
MVENIPRIKEAILSQLDSLPEGKMAEVLSFIHFLKIGLASDAENVLAQAQSIATERDITDGNISTLDNESDYTAFLTRYMQRR